MPVSVELKTNENDLGCEKICSTNEHLHFKIGRKMKKETKQTKTTKPKAKKERTLPVNSQS